MSGARAIHRLSAKGAAVLTKPGRHADGGGLHLSIGKGGSRRWTFVWVRNGKQREAGLGAFAAVSLAEARRRAAECRTPVAKGPGGGSDRGPKGRPRGRQGRCRKSPHLRSVRPGDDRLEAARLGECEARPPV